MSEAKLDQLVKGAPSFVVDTDLQASSLTTSGVISSTSPPLHTSDPLASLPSSPPQIYLNLLILEASLRAQYLELRARRQQYSFFLTLLVLWNAYFGYALFFAPREDGSGVGGSIYWVVEVTEKVAFMGGIVTGILVWGTGQWERGIRWPRRWVGITNRGLRGFNCKIVLVKGPWWKEWWSIISFLFSYGLFLNTRGSSYRHVDTALALELEKGGPSSSKSLQNSAHLPNIHEEASALRGHEEDLAPGGDTIKLLLLPKPFSPAFRENWDLYRTEYWERENERRRILRIKVAEQDKLQAKRVQVPWFSLARFRFRPVKNNARDLEKIHHTHSHSHSLQHSNSTSSTKGSSGASGEKRTRSSSVRHSNSTTHSRTSSRSSTPGPTSHPSSSSAPQNPSTHSHSLSVTGTDRITPEADDGSALPSRRGSTSSTTSSTRTSRKKRPTSGIQKLTPASSAFGGATSTAPDNPSPLVRQNSIGGSSTDGSVSSSRPGTPADFVEAGSVRSLRMGSPGSSPARKRDGSASGK